MPETDRPERVAPTGEQFLAMQASPEFQELRTRLRRFVFPMTAFFLLWYGLYVALGAFAHDFMAIRVFGNINVGLLIGLGQFLTTFVISRDVLPYDVFGLMHITWTIVQMLRRTAFFCYVVQEARFAVGHDSLVSFDLRLL